MLTIINTILFQLTWFACVPGGTDRGLAAILAVCPAPLSYFADERLGAVEIVNTNRVVLISSVWGMLFYSTFRQRTIAHAAHAEN